MNCIPDPKCAYLAMKMVYEQFSENKFDEPPPKSGKGRVKAIHYIQSFNPKDKIPPELAHQISRTFARKAFGDNCQIVIATHVDKEHIHTHFIINTYGIDRLVGRVKNVDELLAELEHLGYIVKQGCTYQGTL